MANQDNRWTVIVETPAQLDQLIAYRDKLRAQTPSTCCRVKPPHDLTTDSNSAGSGTVKLDRLMVSETISCRSAYCGSS